jgi:hypothetical protein
METSGAPEKKVAADVSYALTLYMHSAGFTSSMPRGVSDDFLSCVVHSEGSCSSMSSSRDSWMTVNADILVYISGNRTTSTSTAMEEWGLLTDKIEHT